MDFAPAAHILGKEETVVSTDLIELLQEHRDDPWLTAIKSTYQQIRKELKRQHRPAPSPSSHSVPSRNSPCPCGSGKKYKRCCIDKAKIDLPDQSPSTL